ncbi:hypothetical protein GCM10027596_04130 [Nocardioides korecus]
MSGVVHDASAPVVAGATAPRSTDFGGLTIRSDERLLEPRAWTTLQSRWAADLLVDLPPGPVLEVCSGAGQIGLLAVAGSDRRLVCVDVEPVAAAYTLVNAGAAGLADRVETRTGPMQDVVVEGEEFPLVVADPPWVPRSGTGRFPEDPLLAIDGGEDGLEVARLCVDLIGRHLAPGGVALVQLGTREQADHLGALARPLGLIPGEVRAHADRGVVLRLDRPSP